MVVLLLGLWLLLGYDKNNSLLAAALTRYLADVIDVEGPFLDKRQFLHLSILLDDVNQQQDYQ